MEAAGLTEADFPEQAAEIWPENVVAYSVFSAMRTQWRIGMMGAVGLDYTPLFHKMDRLQLDPDDYESLEEDIRTMEYAALAAMNSNSD